MKIRKKILKFLSQFESVYIWGVGVKKKTLYHDNIEELDKYTHRNQLLNEVVFEWDFPNKQDNVKHANILSQWFNLHKIPFFAFYSGNKSIHQNVYLPTNIGSKHEMIKFRKKFFNYVLRSCFSPEELISVYTNIDKNFLNGSHPLKLVGYPHDKTGKEFTCIHFDDKIFVPSDYIMKKVKETKLFDKKRVVISYKEYRVQNKKYVWIDKIARNGLKDGTKRFLNFVYVPYLLNIRKMKREEVLSRVQSFLDKCPKSTITLSKVNNLINHRSNNWKPLSKSKWLNMYKNR